MQPKKRWAPRFFAEPFCWRYLPSLTARFGSATARIAGFLRLLPHMFSYQARLVKSANLRLSSNVDFWTDEIYRHLSQMHPYLANYLQGDVDWSEEPIDEEVGNGVGTVTALIGETPIRIPIVVRDYELKQVDVYIRPDGDMDVLSPNLIFEHMSPINVGTGQRIDPHLENPQGIIGKVASYAESAEDCERITYLIEQDFPKLAESCERLRQKTGGGNAPYDSMAVAYTSGTYKLSVFRKGYRTDEIMLDAHTVYADPESKLAEAGRAAKRDGEVVMVTRNADRLALDAMNPMRVDVDSYNDGLAMITNDGESKLGKLAEVAHFTGVTQRAFITDGAYYDAPEKATQALAPVGTDVRLEWQNMQKTAVANAAREATGFIRDGETVYGPLKVASVFTSTSGERAVSVNTEYGPAELVLSKHAQRCMPAGRGRYLMPESAEFYPMERLTPTRLSPADVLREKVASEGDASFTISHDKGAYHIAVDDLDYAGLSRGETIACLTSLGLSRESTLDCVKQAEASNHHKLTFYGVEHPVAEHRGEALAHPADRLKVDRFIDRVVDLRPAINKLASELDGSDLQDDLNAINLMNQYNATRYADAIDEMEAAKAEVAKILHGIRTDDVSSIDEQTAKDALMALDQIIRGLNDIAASKE